MFIETFVFFDIETTGLPHHEKNHTKITELTFVAASRKDLEKTPLGSKPCVNTLSLVFNPQRRIQPTVVQLTGLSNNLLQHQQIFKDKIQTINSFLENLPKPICLVAHNGNIFDYKILRAEYLDANKELPANIYCVDSLLGFRKILKETNICFENLNTSFGQCSDDYLTDDEDEEWPKLNATLEEWQEIDELGKSFSENINISSNNENKIKLNNKNEKVSYTLPALYKRLLNKDAVGAHRAEVDCVMLLECVIATKAYFLHWADNECKSIDQINPLIRK